MQPPLLALALACWIDAPTGAQAPVAHDGQRGFGAQPTDADLRAVFQARAGPEAEFAAGLRALEPGLRLSLLALRDAAGERGRDELLPAAERGSFELADLHAAFLEAAAFPEPILAEGGDRARALGAMLLDERFRARVQALSGWEESADELRRGLDVLEATTSGFVVLSDKERAALGPRMDLAGSALRALVNDLAVLAPPVQGKAERRERAAAVEQLLALPPAELSSRLQRAEQAAERMSSMLFSSRLAAQPGVVRDRAARDSALAQALKMRAAVLQYLPDTEQGEAAPSEVAALRKHERVRLAGALGLAALEFDPLDEVCAYAAGNAEDFAWGARRSRHLYDRFLALRGIRTHDHLTLKGRRLTAWEALAVNSVTAGL